jgi:hypothetical protein
MIRVFILIPLLFILAIPAQAQFQWLKKKPAPVAVRFPDLPEARSTTLNFNAVNTLSHPKINADADFGMTQYYFELIEAASLKALYHTRRFHQDAESIKNYHTVIDLYISQGHYSEAKWHLLQCNYLAQQIGDIDGMIYAQSQVAMVKAQIGEFEQAHTDLLEVRGFCASLGRAGDVADIDKKLNLLKAKQLANTKSENRYAAVVEDNKGGK